MDFLQRTGTGFTIYYYDPGNPEDQKRDHDQDQHDIAAVRERHHPLRDRLGGALDRVDSLLFPLPVAYVLLDLLLVPAA